MKSLSRYCCQNSECPDCGKKGLKNLSWCGWSGHHGQKKIRMIRCRSCQKMFSCRKGTPLFGIQLPEEKALRIWQHLQEGCGIRQTARLVGVGRETVSRYLKRAGQHARALHDELVAVSPSDQRSAV